MRGQVVRTGSPADGQVERSGAPVPPGAEADSGSRRRKTIPGRDPEQPLYTGSLQARSTPSGIGIGWSLSIRSPEKLSSSNRTRLLGASCRFPGSLSLTRSWSSGRGSVVLERHRIGGDVHLRLVLGRDDLFHHQHQGSHAARTGTPNTARRSSLPPCCHSSGQMIDCVSMGRAHSEGARVRAPCAGSVRVRRPSRSVSGTTDRRS